MFVSVTQQFNTTTSMGRRHLAIAAARPAWYSRDPNSGASSAAT
jgi:hypothetical protein